MLKNFFLLTFRNLLKNKLYTFINISGLSIGILCSLLIWLWVADETSFDQFHPKVEKLSQVWVNAEFDNKINSWRSVPLPVYEAVKTASSSIVNSTVAGWGGEKLLAHEDTRIMKDGYYVGEEFLDMFEFAMLKGDPSTALDEPSSIVITESLAKILFKNFDPMGQSIRFQDEANLIVTGVLKDLPQNSSFQFDCLIPWKKREMLNEWVKRNKTNWGNYSFQVFVELADPTQFDDAQAAIANMLTENGEDDMPRALFLHPMKKWRLESNFIDGEAKEGRKDQVELFSMIAVFILLIACINFMNLSTARSERRAREVGIRKSLGSKRSQIIFQFIGESVTISMIAMVGAMMLAFVLLPYYNELVDKHLIIDFSSVKLWWSLLAIVLVTGLLSGSYPAFYLSSFKPVETLKGVIRAGEHATSPRKVLVVLQFGFSMMLMVSTYVIYTQIELAKDRALGYDQQNLISMDYTDEIAENYNQLKTELLQSGAVSSMTRSNSRVTSINSNNFLGWPGKPEEQKVIFTTIAAGLDYTQTMGIKILHGRDFSKDFVTDSSSIIINKAALELIGLEDPIGTSLDLWGSKRKLIGVIDNVIMASPYHEVKPLFMVYDVDWTGSLSIRMVDNGQVQANLKHIESVFAKYNSAYPFDYQFTDEAYARKYSSINMTQHLATIFSLLAIFITGLGLFGLAAFTAEQRSKEVGIRKVLGASITGLVLLLSKEFSKLVIIAFILAAPLTWYLMDSYLERYQIRIDMPLWIFPLVGLFTLSFALFIVGNEARRVAKANPAHALRSE